MRGTSSSGVSSRKAKPSAASSSKSSNPNSSSSGSGNSNVAGVAESSVKRMWRVGEPVLVKSKVSNSSSNISSSASSSYSVSDDARQQSMRRGKVQRLRSSGAIDIYYENGEVEERVGKDRIEFDQLKASGAKKPQQQTATTSRGTSSQGSEVKAVSKSSLTSRSTPTTKVSTKPARGTTLDQQPNVSSYRPTTMSINRPGNISIGTPEYDIDQRQRAAPSSYPQQQQQRIRTSASTDSGVDRAGFSRKHRNNDEEQAILFSPVAATVDAMSTAAAGAPRRANTADVSSSSVDQIAQNSNLASALGRSSTKSATALRKQSTSRYSDMGEALAENQKQVTDILDTICGSADNATVVSHTSHAVLLCYGCVLMRKLCHLSIESTELFVRHGIVDVLIEALDRFPEDPILQASACGCLAVLAQSSNTSKNLMLQSNVGSDQNVIQLVLNSLAVHFEYSNLTRQVQIYACEVLIELSDYDGSPTSTAMVGHITDRTNLPTMELLVSLLRQSVVLEDKKVTLAANSTLAADSLREYGAISDLSVVMAKYPVDEGIIRFSSAALREIAATSLHQSPSKRVHQTARVILDDEICHSQTLPDTTTTASSKYAYPADQYTERGRSTSPVRSKASERSSTKNTSRGRSKSPTSRPTTSSSLLGNDAGSFRQYSLALGDAPGASFFTTTPTELITEFRNSGGNSSSSRMQQPRTREELVRPGGVKKRASSKPTEERDRLLMKIYGNPSYAGLQPSAKSNRSTSPPVGGSKGVLSHDFELGSETSHFSPLQNNYFLSSELEGPRFVIPPPLSTDKHGELPSSSGAKLVRTPSGRLTPLMNEKIKFSTTRLANPTTPGRTMNDNSDWMPKSSGSGANARPQTAIVVTKLADSENVRPGTMDRGRRERTTQKDSPPKTRDQDSFSSSNARSLSSSSARSRSPASTRRAPTSQSRTILSSPDDNAYALPQNLVATGRDDQNDANIYAAETEDINQSIVELHEFAQQLLKEEARISSLFPRTSPMSPGVNRMSFSDKLHKMIEFAESSMYERSVGPIASMQGGFQEDDEDSSSSRLTKRGAATQGTTEPVELPSIQEQTSFRGQGAAESKPAAERSTTPKSKGSGYKQTRSPASTQRKTQEQVSIPSQTEISSPALPDLKTWVPFGFDAVQTSIVSPRVAASVAPVPEKASMKMKVPDFTSKSDDSKAIEANSLLEALPFPNLSSDSDDVGIPTPSKQNINWDEAHIPEDVVPEEINESRQVPDLEEQKVIEVSQDGDEEVIAEQIAGCEDAENVESKESCEEKLVDLEASLIAEEIVTTSPTKENALLLSEPIVGEESSKFTDVPANTDDRTVPDSSIVFGDLEETTEFTPPSSADDEFERVCSEDNSEPVLDNTPADANRDKAQSEVVYADDAEFEPAAEAEETVAATTPTEDESVAAEVEPLTAASVEDVEGAVKASSEAEVVLATVEVDVEAGAEVEPAVAVEAEAESEIEADPAEPMMVAESDLSEPMAVKSESDAAAAPVTEVEAAEAEAESTAPADAEVGAEVGAEVRPEAAVAVAVAEESDELNPVEAVAVETVEVVEASEGVAADAVEDASPKAVEVGEVDAAAYADGAEFESVTEAEEAVAAAAPKPLMAELGLDAVIAPVKEVDGDDLVDPVVNKEKPIPSKLCAKLEVDSDLLSLEGIGFREEGEFSFIVVDLDIVRTLTHTFAGSGIEDALIEIEVRQKIQIMILGVLVSEAKRLDETSTSDSAATQRPNEAELEEVDNDADNVSQPANQQDLEEQSVQLEQDNATICVQSAIAVASATNAIILAALQSVINGLCSPPETQNESTVAVTPDGDSLAETMKQYLEQQMPALLPPDIVVPLKSPRVEGVQDVQEPPAEFSNSHEEDGSEEEAEEEVSEPMALETRRAVGATIAQSLEKVIEELRSEGTDSATGSGSNPDEMHSVLSPNVAFAEHDNQSNPAEDEALAAEQISVPMTLSIRQNVNAIIASSLENVIQSLQAGEASLPAFNVYGDNSQPSLMPSRVTKELKNSSDVDEAISKNVTEDDASFDVHEDPISVQMAIAIRRSVNGIIALSLESTVERMASLPATSSAPKGTDAKENIAHDDDRSATGDVSALASDEHHKEEEYECAFEEATLPVEMCIAIRRNVNDLISVALENVLDKLPQQPTATSHDNDKIPAIDRKFECIIPPLKLGFEEVAGLDKFKPATAKQEGDFAPLEPLSAQITIAVSRNVEGIIAESLEKVTSKLCSNQEIVDDGREHGKLAHAISKKQALPESNEILSSQSHDLTQESPAHFTTASTPRQDEESEEDSSGHDETLSVQTSIAIRHNISAAIAVSLQNVIDQLRDAKDPFLIPSAQLPADDAEDNYAQSEVVQDDQSAVGDEEIPVGITPEELPVSVAISLRRNVNEIIALALEKVLSEMASHSDNSGTVANDAEIAECDIVGVSENGIGTLTSDGDDQSSLIPDTDASSTGVNAASQPNTEEDYGELSIRMLIAIRWSVSGMIAVAVEKALSEMATTENDEQSSASDQTKLAESIESAGRTHTESEEVIQSEVKVLSTMLDLLEQNNNHHHAEQHNVQEAKDRVSVGMSVAIRHTVNGIIGMAADHVLNEISERKLEAEVARWVEETSAGSAGTVAPVLPAPQGLDGSPTADVASAVIEAGCDDEDGQEGSALSVKMSIAIRRTVNGLIGLSIQAALTEIMATRRLSQMLAPIVEEWRESSSPHIIAEENSNDSESNSEEEKEDLESDSLQVEPVSSTENVPVAELEPESDGAQQNAEVSMCMAIAISRAVNGVIVSAVEKIVSNSTSVEEALVVASRKVLEEPGHCSEEENDELDVGGDEDQTTCAKTIDAIIAAIVDSETKESSACSPDDAATSEADGDVLPETTHVALGNSSLCVPDPSEEQLSSSRSTVNHFEDEQLVSVQMSLAIARSVDPMVVAALQTVLQDSSIANTSSSTSSGEDVLLSESTESEVEKEVSGTVDSNSSPVYDESLRSPELVVESAIPEESSKEQYVSVQMSLAIARSIDAITAQAVEDVIQKLEADSVFDDNGDIYALTAASEINESEKTVHLEITFAGSDDVSDDQFVSVQMSLAIARTVDIIIATAIEGVAPESGLPSLLLDACGEGEDTSPTESPLVVGSGESEPDVAEEPYVSVQVSLAIAQTVDAITVTAAESVLQQSLSFGVVGSLAVEGSSSASNAALQVFAEESEEIHAGGSTEVYDTASTADSNTHESEHEPANQFFGLYAAAPVVIAGGAITLAAIGTAQKQSAMHATADAAKSAFGTLVMPDHGAAETAEDVGQLVDPSASRSNGQVEQARSTTADYDEKKTSAHDDIADDYAGDWDGNDEIDAQQKEPSTSGAADASQPKGSKDVTEEIDAPEAKVSDDEEQQSREYEEYENTSDFEEVPEENQDVKPSADSFVHSVDETNLDASTSKPGGIADEEDNYNEDADFEKIDIAESKITSVDSQANDGHLSSSNDQDDYNFCYDEKDDNDGVRDIDSVEDASSKAAEVDEADAAAYADDAECEPATEAEEIVASATPSKDESIAAEVEPPEVAALEDVEGTVEASSEAKVAFATVEVEAGPEQVEAQSEVEVEVETEAAPVEELASAEPVEAAAVAEAEPADAGLAEPADGVVVLDFVAILPIVCVGGCERVDGENGRGLSMRGVDRHSEQVFDDLAVPVPYQDGSCSPSSN